MRLRWIGTTLVTAVLAAAINYPVAWGLATWSPYRSVTEPATTIGPDGFPEAVAGPDGALGWWEVVRGRGLVCEAPLVARGFEDHFKCWGGTLTPAYRSSGWPLMSVGSVVCAQPGPSGSAASREDLPLDEIARRGLNTSDLPSWLRAKPERRLGLMPLWPGFLVNTVLYTGCWLAVRTALRRTARRNHRPFAGEQDAWRTKDRLHSITAS